MKKLFLFALFTVAVLALAVPGYSVQEAADKLPKMITGKRDFRGDVDWSESNGTIKAPVPYTIPLAGVCVSGAPIGADGTTAPGLAATDSVPAIVWADDEVTPIEYTFRLPAGMEGEKLEFRGLASTDTADSAPEIDWEIYVNYDGTVFDATQFSQTAVTLTGIDITKNEAFTLTPDATTQAGLLEGGWVTLRLWNTATGSGTLELKGLEYYWNKD